MIWIYTQIDHGDMADTADNVKLKFSHKHCKRRGPGPGTCSLVKVFTSKARLKARKTRNDICFVTSLLECVFGLIRLCCFIQSYLLA